MAHTTQISRSPSPNVLFITRKFREKLYQSVAGKNQELAELLAKAPVKQRYVSLDLANCALRTSLSVAVQSWTTRSQGIPPALVGSARRVDAAINSYELRISNLDLFDDYCPQ